MSFDCCRRNVPELDNYRQPGAEWICPECKREWIWDDNEAEGGAWYPVHHVDSLFDVEYNVWD